jgi:hypothetical protein
MVNETHFLANGHYDVSLKVDEDNGDYLSAFIEIEHPFVKGVNLHVAVNDVYVSSRRKGMSFAHSLTNSKPSEVRFPHVTDISVKIFVSSRDDVLYQVSAVGLNVDMLPIGTINHITDLNEVFDTWRKFNAVITLPVSLI